jgi:hypothetical protein
VAATVVVLVVAGCAQPGTQAPRQEAAKLAVGTSDISAACGYLEELTAFGGRRGKDLSSIEALAAAGARKLAGVYAHDQTDIYQGESVAGLLGDSISLLRDCGLVESERMLRAALRGPG